MLPSSTVENYLKAIYQGASTLTPPQRLLPMGQLASALGVVPGTATTMVKALAESGLVEYEPYSGVALTPAGHKLAALVLPRHRLVELFLVRFMGYAWDEVHDEAEQLEHVVSDRLIDRMDEMLGRAPQLSLESMHEELRGKKLQEIAVEVLRQRHGDEATVHYRDWFELLQDAGVRVAGKDPLASFLTQIARAPEVESVRPRSGLYRLRTAA